MKLFKDTRVIIEEVINGNTFRDALYYEQGKEPDDKDIEADAQKRIDDWVYMIEHPPVIPPPTKEEIQKMIDDAIAQKESLESFIAEKEAEIAIMDVEIIEE